MRLLRAECFKVWSRRGFLLLVALMVAANTLLLWVGSRPGANRPQPESYRTMQRALAGLSMQEKLALVQADFERADALAIIDQVYRMSAYNDSLTANYLREQHADTLAEYEQLYLQGGNLKYTSSLFLEYRFLYEIKNELEQAAHYEGFLDEMINSARQLAGISIFTAANGAGYDDVNIAATAAAYQNMRGTAIDYAPQKGLMLALGFEFSDVMLVFAMVVLALALVRDERENGLLALVRGTPAGRLPTALAKLGALGLGVGLLVLLLYGAALGLCGATYGLGSLGRSLQSVPALMRSTFQLNVGQYLLCFLLAKWAAAFVTGAGIMAAVLALRHFATGVAAGVAIPAAALLVRSVVPAAGKLNVLKYANPASMMNTNELLGAYRNLYWFGQPISLLLVEGLAALLFAGVFCAVFLLVFSRATLAAAPRRGQPAALWLPAPLAQRAARRRARGGAKNALLRHEAYKHFWVSGVLAVLVLLAAFQGWRAWTGGVYQDAEALYYQKYMRAYEGPYTADTRALIDAEMERFEPLQRLEAARASGQLSDTAYHNAMQPYYGLQLEYGVFLQVAGRLQYVVATPGTELVYESGYTQLFSTHGGNDDLTDALMFAALCALCFAPLFAMEKQSGMLQMLAATPLGRRESGRAKLVCAAAAAGLLALLSLAPRYWLVAGSYGFSRPLASLVSLPDYAAAFGFVNIFALMALGVAARLVACLAMAGLTLWLGAKTGNPLAAAGTAAAVLCLPLLLSLIGVPGMRWVGVWPLFHLPALFTTPASSLLAVGLLLAWAAVAVWSARQLLRWWKL